MWLNFRVDTSACYSHSKEIFQKLFNKICSRFYYFPFILLFIFILSSLCLTYVLISQWNLRVEKWMHLYWAAGCSYTKLQVMSFLTVGKIWRKLAQKSNFNVFLHWDNTARLGFNDLSWQIKWGGQCSFMTGTWTKCSSQLPLIPKETSIPHCMLCFSQKSLPLKNFSFPCGSVSWQMVKK